MSSPSELSLPVKAWRRATPMPRIALATDTSAEEMLGPAAILALVTAAQASLPAASAIAESTPAKIKINPTKRVLRFVVPVTDGPAYLGDINLAVAPDDSLSVEADRLLQMLEPVLLPDILGRLKAAAGNGGSLSEAQLAVERITLTYDSDKLALAIGIPVLARRNASLSLRSAAQIGAETIDPANISGFVNFRSSADLVEHGQQRGVRPPVSLIEGTLRVFGVVAEGESYVSLRKGEKSFRRTGSRLVYDDLKNVIRWSFGDVVPFARSFQGTPTVAGLSAQRFYDELEPSREFRSTGSQSFTLFGPSTVETLVNGRAVERKLLQPGTYTLQDFPLAEGANDVRLLIRDETGRQRMIEFNLYSNRQILEPGVTEFSGFGGVYSRPTRSGIAYSKRWTTSGFVRKGISQQLTAGLNVQADALAQQAGGEVLVGTDIGLIGVDLAASRRTNGGRGYAAAVSYEKIVQKLSATQSMILRAIIEIRSPSFATPGALLMREPLALRASAGWSMTLGRDTFVAADMQFARDRVENRQTYGLRLSSGIGISETMVLMGDVEYERSREHQGAVFRVGLRRRLGLRGSAQVDVDTRGVARASYQNSNGVGVGSWSGSIDVNRTADGSTVNANGSLLTNRFELGLSQFGSYSGDRHDISDVRTSLRVATSIAFADGAVALGRPIQQAFVIADPHRSLGEKRVRLDPQQESEQAHSGIFGGAVAGSLSAYSPRTLIYDVPDAPPGYDLGAGNVQIVPRYKAGYHLEVGSDYHLLVLGRLIDRNDEPISLLAGKAVDLKAPKRPPVTMFTSRGGKFGAQGLRPGKWRIEMPTEPPTIFEVDIKDDPSGTVRLGDIHPVDKRDK